jgi:DNA gyrase/topoisomerase IV subunit B
MYIFSIAASLTLLIEFFISKQTWAVNMSKASDPKIKDFTGEEYTKITFSPDLAKFGMDCLDRDTVDLLSRRAYDIAASSTGVKVYLNGKRVPVYFDLEYFLKLYFPQHLLSFFHSFFSLHAYIIAVSCIMAFILLFPLIDINYLHRRNECLVFFNLNLKVLFSDGWYASQTLRLCD